MKKADDVMRCNHVEWTETTVIFQGIPLYYVMEKMALKRHRKCFGNNRRFHALAFFWRFR